MNDARREILNQVASGTLTPAEAAARLEALDQPAAPAVSVAAGPTVEEPPGRPATPPRRVKVVSHFGVAEIVGDSSVDVAVADGPHRAHQDADTMLIEHQPFEEADTFAFGRRGDRQVVVSGLDWQRRRLVVRVNPSLPLELSVQAGNVKVEGMHGALSGEVQAGNLRVSDFWGPLDLSVQAGNLTASGKLDSGESKLRCEMGSVRLELARTSSVRVAARTQLGKISVDGADDRAGKQVTIGTGAGSLQIECTMGNVKVAVE